MLLPFTCSQLLESRTSAKAASQVQSCRFCSHPACRWTRGEEIKPARWMTDTATTILPRSTNSETVHGIDRALQHRPCGPRHLVLPTLHSQFLHQGDDLQARTNYRHSVTRDRSKVNPTALKDICHTTHLPTPPCADKTSEQSIAGKLSTPCKMNNSWKLLMEFAQVKSAR